MNIKKTKKQIIEELDSLQNELNFLKCYNDAQIFNNRVLAGTMGLGMSRNSDKFGENAAGILNCLPANIALIDESGEIITVNSEWVKFAEENNNSPFENNYIGINYLEICDSSKGAEENEAKLVAKGIKEVLNGKSPQFSHEYPCHSGSEKRWFRLFVNPIMIGLQRHAVVMHINITETIKIKEALSESELRYKAIFNNASDAIFISDTNGNILEVNDEACRRLSYSRAELLKMTPQDFSDPGYSVILDKKMQEVFDDGYSVFETIHLKRDGTHIPTELNIRRIDINGKAAIVAIGRDITLRKTDEEEINKLSLAVEQSPVIVVITDKKGNIEYVNPRFTEVTGYTFMEALGKNPRILKSGFTADEEYQKLWSEIKAGNYWKGEFLNRKKNGEMFWELASIFPLKNSSGEVTRFVAVKEDITEKKAAELRLAEYKDHLEYLVEVRTASLNKVNKLLSSEIEKQKISEDKIQSQLQFLRTLIDTIPSPIVIKNKSGILIDCNKAFEKYFGLTPEMIINKRADVFSPEQKLDDILEMEKCLLESPGNMAVELCHFVENGEPFTLLINESTYLLFDNSIGGTVSIMIDITEQKKLQEKIEKALQKEQELNELKSRFISTASHEFRTPLTSILASADLLEMFGRKWSEDKYFEHTGKIQKAVDYMKEILDDVLIISRNEEGKTKFAPGKINFFELCSESFDNASVDSSEHHSFIFNYIPEEKLFNLDPKLLRYIISNLLSNAVKYSPNGGRIILNVETEENNLIIDVKDEGIGIPSEDMGRLFEPFHRALNTGNIHGTGLGLSIVKRSVELHGGRITLESEENKGTSIHVRIPYN